MKGTRLISFFFAFLFFKAGAQHAIRGLIVESEAHAPMPFVYIINKGTGNGTMSDNEGRFLLGVSDADTVICSYVGYLRTSIAVRDLKKNEKGLVIIELVALPVNLAPVTVSTFKIKPYERDYMQSIIDQSMIRKLDYATSPVSALYMQYSKEGRQIRKLAKIFEEIIVEEQAQKKLNREILVRLTGDENIDYAAFRKYCYYLSNYYVAEHDGVELYSRVMDCYKRWKAEGRNEPPRRREQSTYQK